MIKACIFDLDGTLLNTLPTIKHYLNATLGKFGYRDVSDSDTKRYIGDGAYMLIKRALGE
nr:HAD hydrolase-like protein [Clostridia bacterium]